MMGVMSFIPLQMHMGAGYPMIGLAMSMHIAAMYGLSPVMGSGWRPEGSPRRTGTFCRRLRHRRAGPCLGGRMVRRRADPAGLGLVPFSWPGSTLVLNEVSAALRPSVQGVFDLAMNVGGVAGGTLTRVLMQGLGFSGVTFFVDSMTVLTAVALPKARVAVGGTVGIT
jgi:hypothetical protein